MRKKNLFFCTFISLSLILAGASALLLGRNEDKTIKADATFVEPNDVFSKIFSDDWNNVTFSTGFNSVLLCFTGTANGLTSSSIYDASVLNNILVNGAPLYNTGGCVIPWGDGQNWFRVVYPTSMLDGEGTILEIKNDTVVGDSIILGFTLILNGSNKWEFNSTTSWAGEYVFTDPVNATYSSIYSDDFNNGTHATGYNRLMFTYTGTSHGNPAAITTLYELKKYDGYITIDGNPLSIYQGGSTQIAPWSGQLWIQLIYPESAVSIGSILKIKSGCKIGNAVFNGVTFKLNSSSKWELLPLIEDDPLVQSNDYLLFTPSDLGLSLQNDSIPYYGDLGTTFLDSFAFQFNVNIPSADVATTTSDIKMGSTSIYGESPMFRLLLNETAHNWGFGLFFNNSYNWYTNNKIPSWEGDVTHLVEFYAIKTDSTHMVFLLGVDELLIWKTPEQDISAADFTGHTFLSFNNTGSTKSKDIYSNAPTTEKALTRFGVNKLSASTVAFDDNSETDACLTAYAGAKAYYNDYLTNTQKTALAENGAYANLKNRLVAWAAANGETFDPSAKTFTPLGSIRLIRETKENDNYAILILLVSISTIAVFGLFIAAKRKKQN